ncbi:hypothetical protein BJV74DRAFT_516223 [Russula compacta]|nr:hypothetical protein BJV74DRAFT_516223 [Russula compacta]
MHAYTTLAALALAASAVSPALSAPVRENQVQARETLDERGIFQELGKNVGLGAAFQGGMTLLEDLLGGGSSGSTSAESSSAQSSSAQSSSAQSASTSTSQTRKRDHTPDLVGPPPSSSPAKTMSNTPLDGTPGPITLSGDPEVIHDMNNHHKRVEPGSMMKNMGQKGMNFGANILGADLMSHIIGNNNGIFGRDDLLNFDLEKFLEGTPSSANTELKRRVSPEELIKVLALASRALDELE